MTDNEIIKALECCKTPKCSNCAVCPKRHLGTECLGDLITETLDLINRQKTEIERLEKEQNTFAKGFYKKGVMDLAERLDEIINDYYDMQDQEDCCGKAVADYLSYLSCDIFTLTEELTEGKNDE